jgi:hypothetical protein
MNNLPSGTVTFLFTAIDASMKLAREDSEQSKPGWHRYLRFHRHLNNRCIHTLVGS